jgi:hypothetical protein
VDNSDLERAILSALLPWGWLPETDLLRRLAPEQVVRFRRELLDALVRRGLVSVRDVGDETVVAVTEAGRRAASGETEPL